MVATTPALSCPPVLATPRLAEVLASLDQALATFQTVVRTVPPSSVSGDEARALVARFGEGERLAASGVALFSPVVVETGSFAKEGHASAPDWLGSLSGTSSSVAKGRLAAAMRAASDPVLTESLKEGELSADQLEVVTKTLGEVPDASTELIDLIEEGASHQELREAAAQLKDAARSRQDERLRRARVHANRHFRWHQVDSGGVRGEFLCDEVAWAKVAPVLEAATKERFKAAGGSRGTESLAAHRLDAFLNLLAAGGSDRGAEGTKKCTTKGPAPRAIVIIDAEALRRGTTSSGELCEIEGIGPICVEAAVELRGDSALHYVIKEGFDIKTVTKSTRDVGIALEVALLARDRTCGVPHCAKHLGLQSDHRDIDFGDDGPTELANLVRLCPEHHALKTYGGWRLEGSPGHWKWIAPAHPKSANFMTKARKLAAARAEAQRAAARARARAKPSRQAEPEVEADVEVEPEPGSRPPSGRNGP